MKKESRIKNILLTVNHYLLFFMIIGFVITCCLMLFVSTLQYSMQISFTEEQIERAAKLTFLNVLMFCGIFTLFDEIRRRFFVIRPIRQIIQAAEKMSEGDFTVRVPEVKGILGEDMFNQIGDCFNKMAKELSSVETLRTDFVSNVSHELKTPLAVMQNYATMLQQPGLSEKKRLEYAKSITAASRRLANLITNILRLNKLENQQIHPVAKEFDISEQLRQCLLQFEETWENKSIDISTDIEDDVHIISDPELLELVWNNLLSNAFKFTDTAGMVSVSLNTDNDKVIIRIADTGCGMTPEIGTHIFEKFYQGDTSHATQGNGLGLALVKRVVDIINGEISVRSEIGTGSTFTVKIRRDNHERQKRNH